MFIAEKKYPVILADPPWAFKTYSEKGKGKSAENHYQTMGIKQLSELPVESIANKDSVLLMWTTMPMLPQAMNLIKLWGFKFKTVAFVWMKQTPRAPTLWLDTENIFTGMGYWTRSNCEIVLLATRGKPKRKNADVKQAMLSAVREHSRKPSEIYDRIERLLDGPYIELFARTKRDGWDVWGNQTDKFEPPKRDSRGSPASSQTKPPKRKKHGKAASTKRGSRSPKKDRRRNSSRKSKGVRGRN